MKIKWLRRCNEKIFPFRTYKKHSREIKKTYRKEIEEATDNDQIKTLNYEMVQELRTVSDDYEVLISDRLRNKAFKIDLYVPRFLNENEREEYYEIAYHGAPYLNAKGRNFLRKELFDFRKQKREHIISYVSIFFGVIGAITGLIAVINAG